MSSSRRRYKKKRIIKLSISLVVLLFIILVSVSSIIGANQSRNEQMKQEAEAIMSFRNNDLPVNTIIEPTNAVIATAAPVVPMAESFEEDNNQEGLDILKNGLDAYVVEESALDNVFESELDISGHTEDTNSIFLAFYSEIYGTDETYYEFNGVVNAGDITEQELGYPQLHSYSVVYNDGGGMLYYVPIRADGQERPFVYAQVEEGFLSLAFSQEEGETEREEYVTNGETTTLPIRSSYGDIDVVEFMAKNSDILFPMSNENAELGNLLKNTEGITFFFSPLGEIGVRDNVIEFYRYSRSSDYLEECIPPEASHVEPVTFLVPCNDIVGDYLIYVWNVENGYLVYITLGSTWNPHYGEVTASYYLRDISYLDI